MADQSSVTMSAEQFQQLMQGMQQALRSQIGDSRSNTPAPTTSTHAGNFSRCTTRFGGVSGERVDTFIDAISVLPAQKKEVLRDEVEKMLAAGVIEECESPFRWCHFALRTGIACHTRACCARPLATCLSSDAQHLCPFAPTNEKSRLCIARLNIMPAIKKRNANYTTDERILLLNLVNKYKKIIENKKTDAISVKQKNEIWSKKEKEFNTEAPNNVYRNDDSLHKYYINLKKNTREKVANIKTQQYKTGGGVSEIRDDDPAFDLTLSLINDKTVYGLRNEFDSDNITDIPTSRNEITVSSPSTENNGVQSWDRITPAQLQMPVSEKLKNLNEVRIIELDEIIEETSEANICATDNEVISPSIAKSKRRRPTLQPRASNCDMTKYYTELAKIKFEIANVQKTQLDANSTINEDILKLLKESIEWDIKLKKQKLEIEQKEFILKKRCYMFDLKLKRERNLKVKNINQK
ncbi:uncharacterized protein CBL_07178, partial [Carabus blaptoides fortunei]